MLIIRLICETVQLVMHASHRTAAVTNSVNLTCSVSTSITQSVADFIYQIGNPTSSDFRGIKAVVSD